MSEHSSLANEALGECGLRQIQEFVLAVALFWCFVHWLICIKSILYKRVNLTLGFTHLTFTMSAEDYSKKEFSEEELAARKNRMRHSQVLLSDSTLHYALGMRGFYLAICIAGWIIHPIACIIITSVSVIYLYFSDHSFNKYI